MLKLEIVAVLTVEKELADALEPATKWQGDESGEDREHREDGERHAHDGR
jgi:hypothetical protein